MFMISLLAPLFLLSYYDYKYQKVPMFLIYITLFIEIIMTCFSNIQYPLISTIYIIILWWLLLKDVMKWADVVILVPLCAINPYIFPLSIFIHMILKKLNLIKNNGFIPAIFITVIIWMCFYILRYYL